MITTHFSLFAFISELQEIRVPCHWANQIKTGEVLASLCWLRHVANDRSRCEDPRQEPE